LLRKGRKQNKIKIQESQLSIKIIHKLNFQFLLISHLQRKLMPDGTQEARKEKEDSRALHQSF
jgi:hypothetical protein